MRDLEQKKKITIHLYPLLFLLALAFVVGVFAGRGMKTIDEVQGGREPGLFKIKEKEFKFTSPSLKSETAAPSQTNTELKPFLYKVRSLVETRITRNDATSVSVYFRDLNNGHWFGINEQDRFSAGSLSITVDAALATAITSPHISHSSTPLTSEICVRRPVNAKNAGSSTTITMSRTVMFELSYTIQLDR